MNTIDTQEIAKKAFSSVFSRFPALQVIESKNDPVEINLTIPEQAGLKFKVRLGLQNTDELYFSAGHFWLEWYPCSDPQKLASYIDAITGFLAGNYRILEHYRGGKCVKAELQEPINGTWQTIGTWATVGLPFPWKKTFNELRNV